MEIRFHVTGAERKALVEAVSALTRCGAVYKKAPSFAYVVRNYTIDKNGTLLWDERTDARDARQLLAGLPGAPEAGHVVHGYEITRSVWFDNQRGFAIGHNPNAPDPFVCWQFTAENGARDFYWGRYCGSEKAAAANYAARTLAHMKDELCGEIPNPLAAAEMSAEQNYNMIDGLRNNMTVPKADLADGQTHEELRELAPEALAGEKPSVLEQIKEAKDAKDASRPKKESGEQKHNRFKSDLER